MLFVKEIAISEALIGSAINFDVEHSKMASDASSIASSTQTRNSSQSPRHALRPLRPLR